MIYLRNVKSFVFRAGRKVPHCQKWDCHALPLFALDRAISRLFLMSFFISGETKNGRAKSMRWSVWQSCFWGCDMTLGTHPAASKVRQKPWNHKRQEGWHKHPLAELGRTAFGVQILYTFPTPKWASNKSNSSVTSSCGFLRSRLESQSWNSFNPFPHCKQGFSRCTDSGKTPQLTTSKLEQNCGKTEVLHLQPSYGICWSHEIETLPECKQRIHPVFNIYYYSLTGWYWTPGDIHNPTRKVAALGV